MQISFTLTSADFFALHKVIAQRIARLSRANSKLFLSNLFIWIVLGFSFASYGALFRKYPEMSFDLIMVAVVFCVGVALMVAGMLYKQRIFRGVMLSPKSWFLSQQTVDLDSEGMGAKGAYGTVRYPWSSFSYLEEDEKNLYLFIDNSQAFVLPKAALGSSEQMAHIKERVSGASAGPAN